MQKTFDQELQSFVRVVLRRASLKWKYRNEALKLSRVERGMYKCNLCEQTYSRSQINIDHIIPVVDIKGFTTWDDYIKRLYGKPEEFQILCSSCHSAKTSIEQEMRKEYRKRKKKLDTQLKKK